MKRIIMCPPEYYNIEYSINPWMNTKNRVKKEKAFQQFQDLKNVFINNGVEVAELIPVEGLPDMIYATNSGYAEDKIFIKSNFKAFQRLHEADSAAKYFKEHGYEIYTLPKNITFEGEGDLIRSENKYFIGFGNRTDVMAKDYIEDILNKEIFNLELVNPYFYHLDTCLGPLNDNVVVINPEAFTKEGLKIIKSEFNNIIIAGETDNNILACNLVVNKNDVFIGKGISEKLRNEIEGYGFNVNEIAMSEFLKGGGSIKCLTLEIFD